MKNIVHNIQRIRFGMQRHGINFLELLLRRGWLHGRKIYDELLLLACPRRLRYLQELIEQQYPFIDICFQPMGWKAPLVQRRQHISIQAAQRGGLALSGSLMHIDGVRFWEKQAERLYLVNTQNTVLSRFLLHVAQKSGNRCLVRIQSTDFLTTIPDIKRFHHEGMTILYEYIDPFSPLISVNIPDWLLQRHSFIIENDWIYIAVTSRQLWNEIPAGRKRCFLSPNGVDIAHWKREGTVIPEKLIPIVGKGKPLVGYHGALAAWLDYDLLKYIAASNKFSIVLIGDCYDGSLKYSRLLDNENIYYIGHVIYADLPRYAHFYDIAIIPFLKNHLTDAVSPIKLFEYMAAGLPIVTTDIEECKFYKGCDIAYSYNDFLEKLQSSIFKKNDKSYQNLLQVETLENSWDARADTIFKTCLTA